MTEIETPEIEALASPPTTVPWVPMWPLAPATGQGLRTIYDSGALAAAAASIDIQGIPQTFTNLRLVLKLRGDVAATVAAVQIRFNNDSSASYAWQNLVVSGATSSPGEGPAATSARCGRCPGASAFSNEYASIVIEIPNYTSATHKAFTSQCASREGSGTGTTVLELAGFDWAAAAPQPISRITVFPTSGNFVAGCRATLYGIDSTQVALPIVNPSYGITLPSSPVDGQEHILVDSVTAPTYQWRLRYNAGSSSPYKWEFVGGTGAVVRNGSGASGIISNTYVQVGSLFTLPRAGDYEYTLSGRMTNASAGNWVGLNLGVTTPDDTKAIFQVVPVANLPTVGAKSAAMYGVSGALVAWGKVSAGTASFTDIDLNIRPLRVA